jgi:hypothetical protein
MAKNPRLTILTLLDDITVSHHPTPMDTDAKRWITVETVEDGPIAYFYDPTDAYRFRLDLINRRLNP